MTEPSQPTSPVTCPSINIVEEPFVNLDDEMEIEEEMDAQVTEEDPDPLLNSTEDVLAGESAPPHPFKRGRKAKVWNDFLDPELIKGVWKSKCKYCDTPLSHLKSKATTHFNRHSIKCAKKALFSKRQKLINFLPSNSSASASQTSFVSALHDGQLDMSVMREGIAHWILMHEHPFRIVEEEGFILMMKRGIPQYKSMSRHTIRNDCFKLYESEKKKLKELLKGVEKISLTTDLWKSKPKKIEYMVLTGHFVDSDWKLQKRVLNFVHLPPPRRGSDIANCIFKCLKEWDIENKVFTISVDNASANDTCIQVLKDTFSLTKRLICDGKLFHVRCCAHILNIMVQHGLKQVKTIIANVHESVDYINQSDLRLKKFTELVQQFNLKERRLILECKTRWNSTYEMLACAIKFKKVFARLAQEDHNYTYCPNAEDWVKIEKLIEILEVFNDTTNIISGSEYPTSNLFLAEVYRIKVLLDKHSDSSDEFVKKLVLTMKERFDKYWGQCNLLMAIGAVLDPRMKMKVVEITFPKMYPSDNGEGEAEGEGEGEGSISNKARENINKVRETLYELYKEYVAMYSPTGQSEEGEASSSISIRSNRSNTRGLTELLRAVRSENTIESRKSEVDDYLDEGCYVPNHDECFDALDWWKDKSMKFRVLSKMAADILAVPITTVASEATFSAGSRVIDPYRASLSSDAVQMLLCTGDWCRSLHGLKRKNKNKSEDQPKEICLPLP